MAERIETTQTSVRVDAERGEPHTRVSTSAQAGDRGIGSVALHPFRRVQGADVGELAASSERVIGFGTHIGATLDWAVEVGHHAPRPGRGKTARLWELLASVARLDVGAARILEPHLDALAILGQARAAGADVDAALAVVGADTSSSWGVFAAEGPGARLEATRTDRGGWRLDGAKPWCSLAQHLSHALVTAWTAPDARGLFAVSLRAPGVSAREGPWVSRGLSQVVSAPVDFDDVTAVPIGDPGWYLRRQGFAWGGIGVAAVWWGGVVPLGAALREAAAHEHADQLALVAAGEADAALWAARSVLAEAADAVDTSIAATMTVLAERVRAVVAVAAGRVLQLSGEALGPGPLTSDEPHARRVADLQIYLRQHHGARDHMRLGRLVVSG